MTPPSDRRNKTKRLTLLLLIISFPLVALADDFKTIEGKEYKNVNVSRVEPDGIVLITKSGISKIYFTELSPEVKRKYGYNPDAAADFQKQEYEAGAARAQEISRAQQKQAEERERYWSERTRIKRQQEPEIPRQQQQAEQPGAEQQQIIDRQNEILFRLGKVQRPGSSVVLPPPKEQTALWKEYLQLQMSREDLPEQARQQAQGELATMEQEEEAKERQRQNVRQEQQERRDQERHWAREEAKEQQRQEARQERERYYDRKAAEEYKAP